MNSKYSKPGGPVLFFDRGESSASDAGELLRTSDGSFLLNLAQRFHGIAVVFEHRFYGKSRPFQADNSSTVAIDGYDAYKYLNLEQALEDVVYFAKHFQPADLDTYWSLLKPTRTPWIWLRGSYPGIRGAILRVRNPEIIFATWASSAPTQATVNAWVY